MVQEGELRDLAKKDHFPPKEWWTKKIHPALVEGLELVYDAYKIDSSYLWQAEHAIGESSQERGNLLSWPLAAMIKAAKVILRQREEEDTLLLSGDDPTLRELGYSSPREQRQGSQPQNAVAPSSAPVAQPVSQSNPAWQENTAYVADPASRMTASKVARNLSDALEGSRHGLANGQARDTATGVSTQAPVTDAALVANTGEGQTLFDRQLAARDAVLNARRNLPPSQTAQPLTIRIPSQLPQPDGETRTSTGPAPTTAVSSEVVTAEPQAQSSNTAGPSNQSSLPVEVTAVTPSRRTTLTRSTSSPHLAAAYTDVPVPAYPISAVDLIKIKDSEKRNIKDLQLKFGPRDYLDEFIKRAELPLSEATHLKENEKANLLLTMLTAEVKEALQGHSALTNPAHPQLVYDMLRGKYPASESQLVIELGRLTMVESDSALEYLNKVQKLYVFHQIVLPHTFKEIMDIYLATSPGFVAYCSQQVEMREHQVLSVGKDVRSIQYSWDDLLKWGRKYDVNRDLMTGVKARHRNISSLNGAQSTHTMKTRAGRSTSVSTAEPATPRGQSYGSQPGSARSFRSAQDDGYASSGGASHQSRRSYQSNSGKSPRGRSASGGTPYRKPFQKTPSGRNGGGRSDHGNIASAQIVLNWLQVNIIHSVKLSEEASEVDDQPIVISTLPLNASASAPHAEVNAVSRSNRRPNLPEPISQEDLDTDNEPLNLPEAMRRGLRQVQNLPVNNPYAKLLGAQFMMSFRQLAGLCGDQEFSDICQKLLELSLRRSDREDLVTSSRAAVDILQLAFAELPIARVCPDRRPVQLSEQLKKGSPTASHLQKGQPVSLSIVHMAQFSICIDLDRNVHRLVKLDSGAGISCISLEALQADQRSLLQNGKLHKLLTPMTLSGFASAHLKVEQIIMGVQMTIGQATYQHDFLVVPKLVCGYLIGQDFMRAYDMKVDLIQLKASMGVTENEWRGRRSSYVPYQDIDITVINDEVDLVIDAS